MSLTLSQVSELTAPPGTWYPHPSGVPGPRIPYEWLVPSQNGTGQRYGRFPALSEPPNHTPCSVLLVFGASAAMQTPSPHTQRGRGAPQTPHPQGGWGGDAAGEGGHPDLTQCHII